MKVIFSHGKESGPWGRKIRSLATVAQGMGMEVASLDYTSTLNPDARVGMLEHHLEQEVKDVILVGSSMGGYVSLVNAMKTPPAGLFLIAPALYMPGYSVQNYHCPCHTEVVHGWDDDVIPVEHSIKFCRQSHAILHVVPGDHSLSAELTTLEPLFAQFLKV